MDVIVRERREHTAIAVDMIDGEELVIYRGNLQSFQRNLQWDWSTITVGTTLRVTPIAPEKHMQRRRGIEVLILKP